MPNCPKCGEFVENDFSALSKIDLAVLEWISREQKITAPKKPLTPEVQALIRKYLEME